MLIAIGLFLRGKILKRGSRVPPPLSAPHNLSATETAAAITFMWRPPISWGPAGPHATNKYEYEVRQSAVGSVDINTRPWTRPAQYNSESLELNWQTSTTQEELIQFRVRARPATGLPSEWLTSRVYAEGRVVPRSRYSGRYSGRYRGT